MLYPGEPGISTLVRVGLRLIMRPICDDIRMSETKQVDMPIYHEIPWQHLTKMGISIEG